MVIDPGCKATDFIYWPTDKVFYDMSQIQWLCKWFKNIIKSIIMTSTFAHVFLHMTKMQRF